MRKIFGTLVVCAVVSVPGCGDDDNSSPPPPPSTTGPFTAEAAREAHKHMATTTDPAVFCALSTTRAQRWIEQGMFFDHGLESPSCEEAIEWQLREDPDKSPGRLDAEERRDIAIEPDMDRKTQTAGFIDEFGNGVVFKRVEGRWLFAGIVTR